MKLDHSEKGGGKCERDKNTVFNLIIQNMMVMLAGNTFVKSAGEEIV